MASLRGIHGYASIKDMLNPDGMQRPETWVQLLES